MCHFIKWKVIETNQWIMKVILKYQTINWLKKLRKGKIKEEKELSRIV